MVIGACALFLQHLVFAMQPSVIPWGAARIGDGFAL